MSGSAIDLVKCVLLMVPYFSFCKIMIFFKMSLPRCPSQTIRELPTLSKKGIQSNPIALNWTESSWIELNWTKPNRIRNGILQPRPKTISRWTLSHNQHPTEAELSPHMAICIAVLRLVRLLAPTSSCTHVSRLNQSPLAAENALLCKTCCIFEVIHIKFLKYMG